MENGYSSGRFRGMIGFEQHKIHCIIGTLPHERSQTQDIYVDLQVEADFSKCAATDDLKDTVNYETLASICTSLAESKQYQLLETFAWDVLQALFSQFEIQWAKIKVKKPQALPSVKHTMIELQLNRDQYGMDSSYRRG